MYLVEIGGHARSLDQGVVEVDGGREALGCSKQLAGLVHASQVGATVHETHVDTAVWGDPICLLHMPSGVLRHDLMTLLYERAKIRCLRTILDAPFLYFAGSLHTTGDAFLRKVSLLESYPIGLIL